jgi:RNA 3'-phosphate cyclase
MLVFVPEEATGGDLRVDIGTAGAIGLVLQTLMLPALSVPFPVKLTVTGGTDVQWAPTTGYVRSVLFSALAGMGAECSMEVCRRGYYPHGGGEIRITLSGEVHKPVCLVERGAVVGIHGVSHASKMLKNRNVAERQLEAALSVLGEYPSHIDIEYAQSRGPGSGIDLWAETAASTLGASVLGIPGKPAESIGLEAGLLLLEQLRSEAGLDLWMGDQILPYLVMARGISKISIPALTSHSRTTMWVIGRFLPATFRAFPDGARHVIEALP